MKTRRYLAAIMFTDLAGYSRLASTDEGGALSMLEANRQLQRPIIRRYGSFVKEMGDGMLARFQSAQDAVACAIEIQSNAPTALRQAIRIGIHLGDITEENGDIFGDGVNIAARIESIAEPGSIYVSASIHQAIKSTGDILTEPVGPQQLKHIEDPIDCYRVLGLREGVSPAPPQRWRVSKPLRMLASILFLILLVVFVTRWNDQATSPAIAVLPFTQTQGDTSDLYLQQALPEELIRNLGRHTGLLILNPKSSFQYRSSINPFDQGLAEEMSIPTHFVRGEYAKRENRIDLAVSVDDRSAQTVWSGNDSHDEAHLPNMIAHLAGAIAQALSDRNEPDPGAIAEIQNVDPETYRLYLQGMHILGRYNLAQFPKGIALLEQATSRSPADARAWAGLAEGYVWLGHTPTGPPWAWHKAKSAAVRALQLDSVNAEAWAALAHTKTYFEYDYEGALAAYQKAHALNPNMAFSHYHYAWHLYLLDSLDKAIEEHKIAQQLDPFAPVHTFWLGGLYLRKGDLANAKRELRKAINMDSTAFMAHALLGETYSQEGKMDSAEASLQQAMKLQPFVRYIHYRRHLQNAGQWERSLQLIHEAKERMPPGGFTSWVLAGAYADHDSTEQFFEYANDEPAFATLPWLRHGVKSEAVLRDPRFKQFMDKLNLPMPQVMP